MQRQTQGKKYPLTVWIQGRRLVEPRGEGALWLGISFGLRTAGFQVGEGEMVLWGKFSSKPGFY
jgi:hypothetical protein